MCVCVCVNCTVWMEGAGEKNHWKCFVTWMTWCQNQCFVFCVYYLATSVKFKTKHQNQLVLPPMPFQICIGLSLHVMQGIFFGSWPMCCGQKHTGLTHFPCSSMEHRTDISVMHTVYRLQALVYDILPSTTALFSYAIGSRRLSANEQFFCWSSDSSKFITNNSN